jgi:hypothetical protein
MAVKIVSDDLGRSVKMGRRRAISRGPRLSLKNYLRTRMPPPPAVCDYTAKGGPVIAQMLGNDRLGDCTAAAAFHISGIMLANAGAPVTWDVGNQVIPFYSATGGYISGNGSTDNGANEIDVLNYWHNHGLLLDGSHKILAWMVVDATSYDEVATSIWLFENVYFGIELPDAWVNPVPSVGGFTWGIAGAANPDNGHAFPGLGYDADGVKISTWGMTGTLTWPAVQRYARHSNGGELYTVFSVDSIERATAKAPNGLNLAQLMDDIRLMHPDIAA